MLNWFKKKDKTEIYQPDEKRIFKYWNGERKVQADPLVLFKRYSEKRPELSKNLVLAKSIHSDADKGHNWAMDQIRGIFSIKSPENSLEPWASKTLSEDELGNLLVEFLGYLETLKKNSSVLQTTSNTLEVSTSFSKKDQPTNNSVDSGSTPSVWSIGKPEPLRTESALPSEATNQDLISG